MRPEKLSILAEIRGQVENSGFVILADYKGLKVEQFTELRRQLHATSSEIHVVKNRLLRLVAREHGWNQLDSSLQGPSAMVIGSDVTQAAKVLARFSRETNLLTVKAGVMEGRYLTAAAVAELAILPSREELLASLVGTLAAPMTRLVGVMRQKVASVVYVLKAIEAKKSA